MNRAISILVADDEEDLRLLVQVTLENPSYQILSAIDGHTAVKAVQQYHPDLLILDWNMPGLNGCEVLAILRQNKETATIPVIMLTANDGVEAREQMNTLGLAGYLVKPFSPLALIQKVKEILEP